MTRTTRHASPPFRWMLFTLLLLPLLGGCGNDPKTAEPNSTPAAAEGKAPEDKEGHAEEGEGHKEGEEGHEEEASNEVKMSPDAMKDAGIRVDSVTSRALDATLRAPARITPTQNGRAHVGSLVSGRVSRLLVTEGTRVAKGAALAEIESAELGEMKAEYGRAVAEVDQTRAALARQQQLVDEKIGAQRNLEEAQAAYRSAVASRDGALTKLRAAGAGTEPGGKLTLRAPVSGTVSKQEVTLGQHIEPNVDLFEVLDTRQVYADAQLPPDQATELRIGGRGQVRHASGRVHTGKIIFISPTLDAETRTLTVRLALDNSEGDLRPESFVTAEFITQPGGTAQQRPSAGALVVPATAIERAAGESFVYRASATEANTFDRVEVKLGTETATDVVVEAGLNRGDRIVTEGVFYLRSARQKGELADDDH